MGRGRKKIDIKLIQEYNNRMVTFSRRRKGVFRKAQKIHDMSGAPISVAIISESGKAYILGSPSLLQRTFATVEDLITSSSTINSNSSISAAADKGSINEEGFENALACVKPEVEGYTNPEEGEFGKEIHGGHNEW